MVDNISCYDFFFLKNFEWLIIFHVTTHKESDYGQLVMQFAKSTNEETIEKCLVKLATCGLLINHERVHVPSLSIVHVTFNFQIHVKKSTGRFLALLLA